MPNPTVNAGAYFDQLVSWTTSQLQGDEVLLANFSGEQSDFMRFNNARVRQAGSVTQFTLRVDIVEGNRHAEGSLRLSNDMSLDQARIATLMTLLREQRRVAPEDPFLAFNTDPTSAEHIQPNNVPDAGDALAAICSGAGDDDLVGIYASGEMYNGFANSLGQRNWHQSATFNLDWSFYLHDDKAAKNGYAGFVWDDAAFADKLDWSRRQLAVLGREPLTISPGQYRSYLAPAALQELLELWSWDSFGERSHRTLQTPLLRMVTDNATLSDKVTIREDILGGVAPNFGDAGYLRPDQVVLVDGGRYGDTLVSPRSAVEYGVPTNGASVLEAPSSLVVDAGTLTTSQAVEAVDTGLFVGNLWYTNYSDRQWCRTTGMTRFATFWVENGEIVAPVNVMRFDDTAYSLLGDNLEALTAETEMVFDSASYGQRSTDSFRLPGALINDMTFTL